MSNTSSAVKRRYNQKAYKQYVAQLKPDLFERIIAYQEANGLSKPQFLLRAIDALAPQATESESDPDADTGNN